MTRERQTPLAITIFARGWHTAALAEVRGLDRLAATTLATEEQIENSANYTAAGRQDEIRKLRAQALADPIAQNQRTQIDRGERRIEQLEAEARRDVAPPADERSLALRREVRDWIRTEKPDALRLTEMINEALGRTDNLFIDALLEAPPTLSVLTPVHRALIDAARLATSPHAEELRSLRQEVSDRKEILGAFEADVTGTGIGMGIAPTAV